MKIYPAWCQGHMNIVRNSRRTTRWINGIRAIEALTTLAYGNEPVMVQIPDLSCFVLPDRCPALNTIQELVRRTPACCKVPDEDLACILEQSTTEGNKAQPWTTKLPLR